MAVHEGGCHCGRIAFTVEGDIEQVFECNCSICSKRGSLHWFVPADKLRLKTPDDSASTYLFNKRAIRHRFCATCGVAPYGEGEKPNGGGPMVAVNARCVEGFDVATVKIVPVDGRSF